MPDNNVLSLRNGDDRCLSLRVVSEGRNVHLVVEIDDEALSFPISGRGLRKLAKRLKNEVAGFD